MKDTSILWTEFPDKMGDLRSVEERDQCSSEPTFCDQSLVTLRGVSKLSDLPLVIESTVSTF